MNSNPASAQERIHKQVNQLPTKLTRLLVSTLTVMSGAIIAPSLPAISLFYRQVKGRLGFVTIYGVAFVNLAAGYVLICLANSYGNVLAGLAITGIGLGLLFPNINLALTSSTPDTMRGRVLSGVTTCLFLGQFLSPLVSQPISTSIGLKMTYGLAAGLMVVLTRVIALLHWR